MKRTLISLVILGIILYAHVNQLGAFVYGLCMLLVLLLAGLAYGGLFAFFLVSGLIAFTNVDMHSESIFSSVFLPFYSGFSIMCLLAILVLMNPKLLGQKLNGSRAAGFWIGGL